MLVEHVQPHVPPTSLSSSFRIETYQNQLRALATMIDSLIPLERQIEQKLDTYEYNNNYQVNATNNNRDA